MNPITAENLAIYPRRLPTNRPNPYQHPNAFAQLAQGLDSYETRQCLDGRGLPTFATPDLLLGAIGGATNSLTALLPEPLQGLSAEQATQLVGVLNTYVAPALQLDLLSNAAGRLAEHRRARQHRAAVQAGAGLHDARGHAPVPADRGRAERPYRRAVGSSLTP